MPLTDALWPWAGGAVCLIVVLRCAARQRHPILALLAGAVCGLGTLAVLALPMRFECGESCPALARLQPDDSQPTHACQKDMPDQHPFSALQQLLTKDQEV